MTQIASYKLNSMVAAQTKIDNLTVVLGAPRSGTSLLIRHLSAHSKILGIMEPFQSRRHEGFACTDISEIASLYGFDVSKHKSIFLKETTTRLENVLLSLELIRDAKESAVDCCLILIVRSPLECYLSQVNASNTLWKEKKMTEVTAQSFRRFCRHVLLGFSKALLVLNRYRYRITTYQYFTSHHEAEVARLLALVPLPFETYGVEQLKQLKGGDHYSLKSPEVVRSRRKNVDMLLPFVEAGGAIEKAAYEVHQMVENCMLPDLGDEFVRKLSVVIAKANLLR